MSGGFRRAWYERTGKPLPPRRSLRELAEDLGIEHRALKMILTRAKDAPKPLFKTGGNTTHRNTWFDRKEFMDWWNSRQNKPDKN